MKEDFLDSYLSLSTAPDRLIHPTKNAGDLLELDFSISEQSKKGAKGGKKDGLLTSLDNFEIPRMQVVMYTSATNTRALSEESRYENVFHLRGTVSLQVYLPVTEKTTVRELVEILTKDLEIQFERRLALLKEAVEDNSKNLSS